MVLAEYGLKETKGLLGYASPCLLINISHRTWPDCHRLEEQAPHQPRPLWQGSPAGSLWVHAPSQFRRAKALMAGLHGQQSRAEQGSENKVGRLTKFPIERQDEMLSFSLSQDVVHSLYRFRFTLCLRQEKGRGERRFYFWQTAAYLPQPHSRRPWITNSPAMVLCTTATCSTVWLSMFKGVLTEALQPGAADEMLRDPPLGTSE